jgi:hypothetical protein
MSKFKLVVLALAALSAAPAVAAAQKLEAGKWTGRVLPPDGASTDVTYDVTVKGDTIGITVSAGEHGTFTFNEVKLADNKLTFSFQPGPLVKCALARRPDGAFEGECTDEGGGVAQMLMVPPKKG